MPGLQLNHGRLDGVSVKIGRAWEDAYAKARHLSAVYGVRYRVEGVRMPSSGRWLYFVWETRS